MPLQALPKLCYGHTYAIILLYHIDFENARAGTYIIENSAI
jgi:hypothetical protein